MKPDKVIKKYSIALALLCGFLIAALCGAEVRISIDDGDAQIAPPLSLAWHDESGSRLASIDPPTDERVREAVELEAGNAGYEFVADSEAADLLISFRVGLDREFRAVGHGTVGHGRTVGIEPVRSGSLTLELLDPQTEEVVWRGTATNALVAAKTPTEQEKVLHKSVRKLLNKIK